MEDSRLKSIKAIFTIAGTIIGAGILALPITMAQLGFIPGFFVLTIVGLAFLHTAYYIGEAVVSCDEEISLVGLAKKYFGTPGVAVMLCGVLIYIYGALIGYLSAGGQVIFDLSGGYIPQWLGTLVYFSLGATIIYCGMRLLASAEFILFALLIGAFLLLNYFTASHIAGAYLARMQTSKLFFVFGIVFFAYNGHSIIPSIANRFKGSYQAFKKIVFWGVFIPYCFYVLWCLVVIGAVPYESAAPATGKLFTVSLMDAKSFGQPATIPLGHLYGGAIIVIGFAFSLFATLTSFLGFGFSLAENFMDLFKKRLTWLAAVVLAVVPPLMFNFANQDVFLKALDIAGTYGAGIFAGIMPTLIILKVRRERLGRSLTFGEKVGPYAILAMFFFVLVYTTVSLFV